MDERQVNLYYEELRRCFINPNKDWADKGATFRTLLDSYFKELCNDGDIRTNFIERIDWYYDMHPEEDSMRAYAHFVRKKLNPAVHESVQVKDGKVKRFVFSSNEFIDIYSKVVLIIYNSSGVMPDNTTLELLGAIRNTDLDGLNDQQKDAVLSDFRIVYVNAGPGTGKTKLLVSKLVHEIRKSSDILRIVALSFTNTAANELGNRFQQHSISCGLANNYKLFNGTIHSYCLRVLRVYYSMKHKPFNYVIVGEDEILEYSTEIATRLGDKYTLEEIRAILSSKPSAIPDDISEILTEIKRAYRLITLNDILILFIRELETNIDFKKWVADQVDLLVVDEAQDLSILNFKIFEILLNERPTLKLFFVGDPRQNIFEFNGGSYKHLDDFIHKYDTEVSLKNLSITYRCPSSIVDYVNTFEFIDCNNDQLVSQRDCIGSCTAKSFPSQADESEFIISEILRNGDFDSSAIISPTIKGLYDIIGALNEHSIPYKVFGGRRILKEPVRLMNHLFSILLNNNENSIRKVAKAWNMDVKTQPLGSPRHFTVKELFYRTPTGRKLKRIANDYYSYGWDLKQLSNNIVSELFSEEMLHDNARTILSTYSDIVGNYKSIQEYLTTFSLDKDRFSVFYEKDFADCKAPVNDSYVTLSTIHSAKGLQWKNVYIPGMIDNNFPGVSKFKSMSDSRKETYINIKKKELFVACTRAEESLTLSYPNQINGEKMQPSCYLKVLLSE